MNSIEIDCLPNRILLIQRTVQAASPHQLQPNPEDGDGFDLRIRKIATREISYRARDASSFAQDMLKHGGLTLAGFSFRAQRDARVSQSFGSGVLREAIIPFYAIVPFFAAFPFARVIRAMMKRTRVGAGRCRACGYSLQGNVSGKCPECGTNVPADQCATDPESASATAPLRRVPVQSSQ
jgi:hypothetical protein